MTEHLDLALLRIKLAEATAIIRAADEWIERAGQFTEAVIIMAEDRTPGLTMLADLALWNDRRRAFLAAPAATVETPAPDVAIEEMTTAQLQHARIAIRPYHGEDDYYDLDADRWIDDPTERRPIAAPASPAADTTAVA